MPASPAQKAANRNRNYYRRNRDPIAERHREWYKRNKEARIAYQQAYRDKQKAKLEVVAAPVAPVLTTQQRYYRKNLEAGRAYGRAYYWAKRERAAQERYNEAVANFEDAKKWLMDEAQSLAEAREQIRKNTEKAA